MSRIFISHSSTNDHQALALREWLAEEGWSSDSDIYLDIHPDSGMAAGQRWLNALEEAATRCEVVVFLVSEAWLSSQWCGDEMRLAQTLNKKIFTLLIEDIELSRLPHGLTAEWQVVGLHTEPMAEKTRRYRTNHPISNEPGTSYFSTDGLQRLKNGLIKAGIAANSFELQKDPNGPFGWRMPYRGLESLHAEDAAVFFGRDADIVRGIDTIRGLAARQPPHMLVVLGASGSGKSSFLRAGLWPRLERDDVAWIPFPPLRVADHGAIDGDEGLLAALAAVQKRFGEDVNRAELREAISSSDKFIDLLRNLRQKAARRALIEDLDAAPLPLIAIDQAEELDMADASPEAGQVLEILRAAMDSGDLIVVATIRSDSYDALQTMNVLTGVHQTPLSLAPIAVGEIAQIIRGPAEVLEAQAGADAPSFSAEVVAELQREMSAEPDALPLLAFALQRLVREHAATPMIGLDQLATTGGVTRAIGAAANAALNDAGVSTDSDERRELLSTLFIPRLARIDPQSYSPQRRVASRKPFEDPKLASLEKALIEKRLLVSKGGEQPTIEVAHEALLRRWPELTDLLFADRESLLQLDVVQRAATAWDNAKGRGKIEFLVHRGQRLMAAKTLLERADFARELEGAGTRYLAACEKAEKKAIAGEAKKARTRKILQRSVALLVVFAAVVTAVGWLNVRDSRIELAASELDLEANQYNLKASQLDLAAKTSNFLGIEAEQEYLAASYDSAMRVALAGFDAKFDLIDPFAKWTLARSAHSSRLLADLQGHTGPATHAAFSPDGERVVTASWDRTARVWAVDTDGRWSAQMLAGHTSTVTHAAFSPDGERVLTASWDGTARVWAVDTDGRWSAQLLFKHSDPVTHAAFSPDGERVLTASSDKTARLWAVRVAGRWSAQELFGHTGTVTHAAFSPDGERVVTASKDKTARVWAVDADGRWSAQVLAGHTDDVNHAAFSPDGERVVTASSDKTARVWAVDADGRWSAQVLAGHTDDVNHAAFSPDGEHVVTASSDKTARVWAVDADGRWSAQVLAGHTSTVNHAAFSPDGERVVTASSDKTARVWAVDADGEWSTQELAWDAGTVNHAAFSPDGERVVTVSSDRTVRVWVVDADGRWSAQELAGHTSFVNHAAFSPDGERVVTTSRDKTARVWAVDADGEWSTLVLAGHTDDVTHAAFSPDGERVVTASWDRTARVWAVDAAGEWSAQVLTGHTSFVNHAVFSLDGERVLTASDDETARVWVVDADGEWSAQVLAGHTDDVTHAAFSPDGERVVTASRDKTAQVWAVDADGRWSAQELLGHTGPVRHAAFSPDGERVLTTSWDKAARVWVVDADGEWSAQVLAGHTDDVTHAAFSPDGDHVLTASSDKTARVWAVDADGEWAAQVLTGHTSRVTHAAFSPDGERVLTASTDNTARVWDVQWLTTRPSQEDFLTQVCKEKLLPTARLITHEDINKVPGLRGREDEDVCERFLRDLVPEQP